MNQKAFTAIFLAVLLIAVISAVYSRANKDKQPDASTAPTGNVFESSSPQAQNQNQGLPPELQDQTQQQAAGQQQQRQQNPQMQQQQPQRQIKQYPAPPPTLSAADLANKKAVIQTSKGTIEFEIYPDSPKAASNFIFLSNEGFYNGLKFHRVVPGFVIQGGDPMGTGAGGPGYKFEDEKVTKKYNKGIVAMANAGPNTNGSQFFIMLEDNPELPPSYTIFGNVLSGQEIVDQIKVGDIMTKVSIEPLQ